MHELHGMLEAFCGIDTCDRVEPLMLLASLVLGHECLSVKIPQAIICLILCDTTSPCNKISASFFVSPMVHHTSQKHPIERME